MHIRAVVRRRRRRGKITKNDFSFLLSFTDAQNQVDSPAAILPF